LKLSKPVHDDVNLCGPLVCVALGFWSLDDDELFAIGSDVKVPMRWRTRQHDSVDRKWHGFSKSEGRLGSNVNVQQLGCVSKRSRLVEDLFAIVRPHSSAAAFRRDLVLGSVWRKRLDEYFTPLAQLGGHICEPSAVGRKGGVSLRRFRNVHKNLCF